MLDSIDAQPFDLDDSHTRQSLANRDPGVRAALDLMRGRKPQAAPRGLTASTAAARN